MIYLGINLLQQNSKKVCLIFLREKKSKLACNVLAVVESVLSDSPWIFLLAG
jgi:hypothetical protein